VPVGALKWGIGQAADRTSQRAPPRHGAAPARPARDLSAALSAPAAACGRRRCRAPCRARACLRASCCSARGMSQTQPRSSRARARWRAACPAQGGREAAGRDVGGGEGGGRGREGGGRGREVAGREASVAEGSAAVAVRQRVLNGAWMCGHRVPPHRAWRGQSPQGCRRRRCASAAPGRTRRRRPSHPRGQRGQGGPEGTRWPNSPRAPEASSRARAEVRVRVKWHCPARLHAQRLTLLG
jgi:hypothetical protein